MPSKASHRRTTTRKGKVRKEFWLDPNALRQAQTLLGAESERETVEIALDLVAFRHEVASGLSALEQFATWAAPGLYLSSVIAAELRAGARTPSDRKKLEKDVLGPFVRRGRVVTPSRAAWDALGLTLATLRQTEGLQLGSVSRSLALDILLAYSCREQGMIMVTRNERDMARIRQVFVFDHTASYPERP